MIEQNSIENLKQRLDIVEVVGHYLDLRKSGASYKAICPFHDDRNPSLHVSPAKQIYHCFVCEAGGDAINFVMEYEKLNYPEALEKLASMYNFSLTYTQDSYKKGNQKKILQMLNEYYKKCLSENKEAKNYLLKRGIYTSTIEKFELGYAKHSRDTLFFLQNSGVSMSECKEVGVADIGQNGAYARFIDRIIFPIFEANGRIVGFGGRTISNHPAKYINSPQTKLFNKSRLLYGYDKAKTDIFKYKQMIIVEGYLDVIMLHQAGFSTAVATLGTALTNEHMPLITRSEAKIILSYDGDSAGIEAAFKASKLLSLNSIDGGVVIFNNNLDPADMVQSGNIKKLNELFANPKPFVEFCLNFIVKNYNIKNPLEKQKALHEGMNYLKSLPKIISSSYKGIFANLLGVEENFIKFSNPTTQAKKENNNFEDLGELTIIKTLLQTPSLVDMVLDTVSPSIFKVHFHEFKTLLKNDLQNPILRRILMQDDIKTFNEDELKNALLNLLFTHYQDELKKIKLAQNLNYKDKSFLIQKIQNILFKLKKGELVSYESFSTI